MTSLTEIFGRIVDDEFVGFKVAEYLRENPHAKAEDLCKFHKVGIATATTLLMIMESSAEYLAGTKQTCITDPDVIAARLAWLKWEEQENLVVMTLDSSNHVINSHVVTKGLINQTPFHPREVLRHAIRDNAVSVVLAHNHPSGSTEPSPEDISITRVLAAACKIMQIGFLDHVIISKSGYYSICRSYPEIFEMTLSKH